MENGCIDGGRTSRRADVPDYSDASEIRLDMRPRAQLRFGCFDGICPMRKACVR